MIFIKIYFYDLYKQKILALNQIGSYGNQQWCPNIRIQICLTKFLIKVLFESHSFQKGLFSK